MELLSSVGARLNVLLLFPRSQRDQAPLPDQCRIKFFIIILTISVGSSSSSWLTHNHITYYYPHDRNGIKLLSGWCGIEFLIIISTTLAGSSSSPRLVRDQIPYFYPHDHSGIKLLSLINTRSNFLLLSPRSQWDRAPLLDRRMIKFLIIILMISGGSSSSPWSTQVRSFECSIVLVLIQLNDLTFRLDLLDRSYSSIVRAPHAFLNRILFDYAP